MAGNRSVAGAFPAPPAAGRHFVWGGARRTGRAPGDIPL